MLFKCLTFSASVLAGASEGGLCNLSSPSFLEWDAASIFLESVMQKIDKSGSKFSETGPKFGDDIIQPQDCVELLRSVLAFRTQVTK